MSRKQDVLYLVGLSGRLATHTYGSLEDLLDAPLALAPGRYYIQVVTRDPCSKRWNDYGDDWGFVEVTRFGRWRLRSIDGMQAGPGYLIV